MKRVRRRNIVGAKPCTAPPCSVQVAAGKGAAQEWVESLPSSYEDVSVINQGRGGHYEFHRGGSADCPSWGSCGWEPGLAGFLIRHRSSWRPPTLLVGSQRNKFSSLVNFQIN